MSDTKQLEDAKARLQRSASSLKEAVKTAKKQKADLKSEVDILQKRLDASTERYSQLERLSCALCDECWLILPMLGTDVHTKAASAVHHFCCVNCGCTNLPFLRIPYQHKKSALPPRGTSTLSEAEDACKEAARAINGEVSHRQRNNPSTNGNNGCNKTIIAQNWISENPYDKNHYRYGNCSTITHTQNILSKDKYLALVSAQKQTVEKELKIINEAIAEWEKYSDQHMAKSNLVEAEIKKVVDREREVLQSKLDKLGGGKKRSRSSLSQNSTNNSCVVCMDRPKEIVFQCGHQCCSSCSQSMINCPTCRAVIYQRIRLFD